MLSTAGQDLHEVESKIEGLRIHSSLSSAMLKLLHLRRSQEAASEMTMLSPLAWTGQQPQPWLAGQDMCREGCMHRLAGWECRLAYLTVAHAAESTIQLRCTGVPGIST